MRRLVIVALLAATADATPPRKDRVPAPEQERNENEPTKPIDMSQVIDKLDVFKDEIGQIYTSPRRDAITSFDDAGAWVFVGDGKKMYRQRIFGSSFSPDSGIEWHVWSPRARNRNGATIALGQGIVYCSTVHDKGGQKKLVQLKADEAKVILTHATFLPQLWHRQAHRLARDDDAIYYFVDRLRDEYGGNGYRVFVGAAGDLKQQQMTNIAHDSGGEVFATKAGQMKVIIKDDDKHVQGIWVRGGKKTELTMLPVEENVYLIYREFGLYGALGTPCDDM